MGVVGGALVTRKVFMEIVTLVNRTEEPLQFMFDSITYELGPLEEVDMSDSAAAHGNAKLIAMLDPVTNMALFLTGMKDRKGKPITDCSPLAYRKKPYEELLDRTHIEGNFKVLGEKGTTGTKAPVGTPARVAPTVSTPKPPAAPIEFGEAEDEGEAGEGNKLEDLLK